MILVQILRVKKIGKNTLCLRRDATLVSDGEQKKWTDRQTKKEERKKTQMTVSTAGNHHIEPVRRLCVSPLPATCIFEINQI